MHLTKVAARVFSVGNAQYTMLFIVCDEKTRSLHCPQEEEGSLKFKGLSSSDSGIICTASTLSVGHAQSGGGKESIAAQIVPEGIRLGSASELSVWGGRRPATRRHRV